MEWCKRRIDTLTPTEYARCLTLMLPERRQKVERLRLQQSRFATVLGEWMIKNALAEKCGLSIDQIRLLRSPQGKPYAVALPVHFSISHSGDWVAVAIDDRPVGIDLEVIRPLNLKIARRVCTDRDLQYLFDGAPLFESTEDPALLNRFFEIWTAKEAYFKQIGTGITDLRSVSYADLTPLHFEEDGCILTIIAEQ